jgi:hypothetical protein
VDGQSEWLEVALRQGYFFLRKRFLASAPGPETSSHLEKASVETSSAREPYHRRPARNPLPLLMAAQATERDARLVSKRLLGQAGLQSQVCERLGYLHHGHCKHLETLQAAEKVFALK